MSVWKSAELITQWQYIHFDQFLEWVVIIAGGIDPYTARWFCIIFFKFSILLDVLSVTYYWCDSQVGWLIRRTLAIYLTIFRWRIAYLFVDFVLWLWRQIGITFGIARIQLVYGGKNYIAIFICFYEAVKTFLLMLVVAHFLADFVDVEEQWRIRHHHLQSDFAEFLDKVDYLLVDVFTLIVCDGEDTLNLAHQRFTKGFVDYLAQNFLPIALIFLAEHVWYAQVEFVAARSLPYWLLNGPKVLFYLLNDGWQGVLVKVDDALEIQFCTQNIKENILAIAFIELTDLIRELIKHRKVLAGIVRALYHWSHLVL